MSSPRDANTSLEADDFMSAQSQSPRYRAESLRSSSPAHDSIDTLNRLSVQSIVRHNETLQELLSQRESDLLLAASIADRLMEKNSKLMATLQETESQLSISEHGRLSAEASVAEANEDIRVLEQEKQDWLEQRVLLQSNLNAALLQRVTETRTSDPPSEISSLQAEIQRLTLSSEEMKIEMDRLGSIAVTAEGELAFFKEEFMQQKQFISSLESVIEKNKLSNEEMKKKCSDTEAENQSYKELCDALQLRLKDAQKDIEAVRLHGSSQEQELSAEVQRLKSELATKEADAIAVEAQHQQAVHRAAAELKQNADALSESQAKLAQLQEENAKMLAEGAEALAAMTSKCENATSLAKRLKQDLFTTEGVATSKAQEASDLQAQLKESEATAGEYMQRCDALQLRLKDAQKDIEAARLHGSSQEQELSAEVQRLKSELATREADAIAVEAQHQQAVHRAAAELKQNADALSESQAKFAQLQEEHVRSLSKHTEAVLSMASKVSMANDLTDQEKQKCDGLVNEISSLQTFLISKAQEASDLQVQLKESEATAGEYMQRCDALQLRLKDAQKDIEAARLHGSSQEQELSAEVQRLKSELATREADAIAVEAQHQQAVHRAAAELKQNADALSESQAKFAQLQEENAKMLAEGAEALAAMTSKCENATSLAKRLKQDLFTTEGVATSKAQEASDLQAQLKESEATAGEYMQRCDALQLRLKDAQKDIEAARLHGSSQEQELSAEVQRLKSELATREADAIAVEAQHQQAVHRAAAELKQNADALSESQAKLAQLQEENAKMLAEGAEALAAMTSKCENATSLAKRLKQDLFTTEGVATSKAQEASDLQAQLKESEATAGEYMQRCDALQLRLKDAQKDIEAVRLHGSSQEQELSAEVQRLKSELATREADAIAVEAQHQQAVHRAAAELKQNADALSESQAKFAQLQEENAKMLAEGAEALAAMTSKCENATSLAKRLKQDLFTTEGVATSKAQEASDLQVQLKESEATAGEYMQRCDALQLRLKDAQKDIEAARLHGSSQEQELSAEVQRLKSELATREADAIAVEAQHQQAVHRSAAELKQNADALSESQAKLAQLQEENAKMLAEGAEALAAMTSKCENATSLAKRLKQDLFTTEGVATSKAQEASDLQAQLKESEATAGEYMQRCDALQLRLKDAQKDIEAVRLHGSSQEQELSAEVQRLKSELATREADAIAVEAQHQQAVHRSAAELKQNADALSESQAKLAQLQEENAKMLAEGAEALAAMTSKCENATSLAKRLKQDLFTTEGVATSKAQEASDLQAQLKESEATAGEYMQRCDALQLRLKDAQKDIEAVRLHGSSQEQELSAEVQRLNSEFSSMSSRVILLEARVSELSLLNLSLEQQCGERLTEIESFKSEVVSLNQTIERNQVSHDLVVHQLTEELKSSLFDNGRLINELQTQISSLSESKQRALADISSKESTIANLRDELNSSSIELRAEQDARGGLQVAIKELDSKLARMSMDALKTSDSLAVANRNLMAKELEMQREVNDIRVQFESAATASTAERESLQRHVELLSSENLQLKSQIKGDLESQLREFEKQLTILEQNNHELSDRLVAVEKERAELEAALSKDSKSPHRVPSTILRSRDEISADCDSLRSQLAKAQEQNAALELELALMKQNLPAAAEKSRSSPTEPPQTHNLHAGSAQHDDHLVAKIASLESDLAQLRTVQKQSLLRSRMNDAAHAEHEVLKELLGCTQDSGPIEKLQCLQWELQNARSELESFQSNLSSALHSEMHKSKAALSESLALRESTYDAARIVFEGLNSLLSKVAANKQLQSASVIDAAAADSRLPWLKFLHKLVPPASLSVVDSICSTLTKLSLDEEFSAESTTPSDDTEVRLLKFKLRALAAQLSRAEKCLLESSPSSLKTHAESMAARNLLLENKIAAAETSLKTVTADRDDYSKRYSSLVSSFSQLSSLNNHIVREVVTLRRKLKTEQAGANLDYVHHDGSRDFDREVEEAANAFSSSFNQVVLEAVEGEAHRSAKKRSIMQEQNELIVMLRKELLDLKHVNSTLRVQLQDALQAPKLMATMAQQQQQQQHVVNVPALYPSAFTGEETSKFSERSAEEEFLTIRLKVLSPNISCDSSCAHAPLACQTLEEVVMSLAARGGVSAGVLEALSRRLASSEMCVPVFFICCCCESHSCRDRLANMTVVDVLSHRLENEQETCRRQTEVINELRTGAHGVSWECRSLSLPLLSAAVAAVLTRLFSAKGRVAASPNFRLCEQMPIANAVDVRLIWFGLLVEASF
jgi:chromosome segregation ATPase